MGPAKAQLIQLIQDQPDDSSAGLDFRYDGPFTSSVGGGLAVLDCDDDGRQDLYLAGGSRPAALFRNVSTVGGQLAFERTPDPATDLVDVSGAYPLDVDADGLVDPAVLRLGENVLLRGLGECRFERANEAWALDGGTDWTPAFKRDLGGRGGPADAGLRQLPRARPGARSGLHVRGEPPASPQA